jgi:hypothetical protein
MPEIRIHFGLLNPKGVTCLKVVRWDRESLFLFIVWYAIAYTFVLYKFVTLTQGIN